MVELNSPTVFGFEVTIWFALFCISLVCALVFLVLLCVGIFNKANKEDRIITKATDNVAKIPVKKMSTPNLNSSVMSGNVASGGVSKETPEIYKTEDANPKVNDDNSLWVTQPADEFAPVVENKAASEPEAEVVSMPETEENSPQESENKNKFCIYCGKPADGKFCVYCGKELN